MKKVFVLAPLVAALVAALPVQAAGSYDRDTKHEASRGAEREASAKAPLSVVLSRGGSAVLPLTSTYLTRVFEIGWSLSAITEERIGNDVMTYRDNRLEQQQRGRKGKAAAEAAKRLAACTTVECVLDYAEHETLLLALQAAHATIRPTSFREKNVALGSRRILTRTFYTAFVPQVIYHAQLANLIEAQLGEASSSAMSFEEREAAFVKAVFDIPLSQLEFVWRQAKQEAASATVLPGELLGEISFSTGSHVYTASNSGLKMFKNGVEYFSATQVAGVTYEYTNKGTAGAKGTTTTTTTSVQVRAGTK